LRTSVLSIQNDDLLAQQRILHDQIVSTSSEIREKTGYHRWSSGFYPRFDMLSKPVKKIAHHAAPGGLYD